MRLLLDPNPQDGGDNNIVAPDFAPPTTVKPKSVTPMEFKEPPKEVLEKTFTVDPVILKDSSETKITLQGKDGVAQPADLVVDKKEDVKPPAEKKVEDKVDDKKEDKVEDKKEDKKEEGIHKFLKPPQAKDEKKPDEVRQIKVPAKKDEVVRDYNGYSQEEIAHFKQMSDPAYKFTTELIKKNKELEKTKESSYLQHPDAYTLTPQYRELQTGVHLAKKESQIWRSLLVECQEGKPIKPLVSWDKDGNPVFGEAIEPTKEIEEGIRMAMNQSFQVANQRQAELANVATQFKTQVQTDMQSIQAERAKRFEWVANPQLLDYTLPVNGVNKSIREIRNEIISIFPQYLHSNPATEVCGDLVTALIFANLELQEARNGKQVAEIKKDEAIRAEPKSNSRPRDIGPAIGGVREFTLDGMPK